MSRHSRPQRFRRLTDSPQGSRSSSVVMGRRPVLDNTRRREDTIRDEYRDSRAKTIVTGTARERSDARG